MGEIDQTEKMLKGFVDLTKPDQVNKVDCDLIENSSVNKPTEKSLRWPSFKTKENSLDKSKKWFNISGFMNRAGSSCTSDNKNDMKAEKRHSWHLNAEM